MLSHQTIHLINSFCSGVDAQHSQNVLLHAIFTRIVTLDRVDQHPALFIEACLTLARMYWNENWAPASVFFYMLTGFMISDDVSIKLSPLAFPLLNEPICLDPNNICGMCDLHCGIMNGLWLNQEDSDDEDDSDEDDSGEEEESEEEEDQTEEEEEEKVEEEEKPKGKKNKTK